MTKQKELIRAITLRAKEMGGRAMLVGGCVRDELMGLPSADIDCEVYGLAPDALRALAAQFGTVDDSGEKYGIFSLRSEGIDLAVPRTEKRIGPHHGDFEVLPDPNLSFERAAARRDFTVNAILRDALTGEIVDPFGGREDLKNRILRAVPDEGFEADPLRVLRGAQFAARFSLTVDEATMEKMRRMPTDALSPARVMGETKKALMQSARPDVYFDILRRAGALEGWFKELTALIGVPQNPKYHPEGDAYVHTMFVLRAAAEMKEAAERPLDLMFAALVHDLGKAVTTTQDEKGDYHSYEHEIAGIPLLRAMLARIGAGKETTAYCENMCRLHMRMHVCCYNHSREGRTNLLFDESVCPHDLVLLAVSDARGKGGRSEKSDDEERFLTERLAVYEKAVSKPMPSGDMLIARGMKPGRGMAQALREARRLTLCGARLEDALSQTVIKFRKENEHERL